MAGPERRFTPSFDVCTALGGLHLKFDMRI